MSQRAVLTEIGWDKDLTIEPVAEVKLPSDEQVAVQIEACGVCFRDCIDRDGRWPFIRIPVTPGHEAVGKVTAVGDKVTDWAVGDRVATMHRDFCGDCPACQQGQTSLCLSALSVPGLVIDGGYASSMVAPEKCFYRVPDDIPAGEAAILHCTYGTAFRGLKGFADVREGQQVLITGANGGVGVAAVQIARRLGAGVTAVVRDHRHEGPLRELGAAHVLVDPGDKFHKRLPTGHVDAVLDCVGEPTFNASLRSLKAGGRLVVVGNVTRDRAALNLGYIITKGLAIAGSSGASRSDMAALLALRAQQPFAVQLHARLDLAEADGAQRMVKAGGLRGRIVLIPPGG